MSLEEQRVRQEQQNKEMMAESQGEGIKEGLNVVN